MNLIHLIRNKVPEYKDKIDVIYLVALLAYYFHLFMMTTMFDYNPPFPIFKISVAAAFLVVIYRLVCLKSDEKAEAGLMVLLLAVAAGYMIVRHERDIPAYIIMIIGAKDVSFRSIVKQLLIAGTIIMIAAIAASQLGVIDNLTYVSRHGRLAYALGIIYTTDFAAHVFYLFLGYAYIRRGNFTIPEYIVIAVLTILMFELTSARNNTICILLFLTATAVYSLIMSHVDKLTAEYVNKAIIIFSIIFIILCVSLTVALTIINPTENVKFAELNKLLSGRFSMGNRAYNEYGITLFGSDIEQMGKGGTSIDPEWYFFLDISYVSILMCKGAAVFASMLVMELRCIIKCINKNVYLLMIFAIIALECSIEHHFGELIYNYFLLAVFANLDNRCQSS